MNARIETVGDLRKLLADHSDNTPLEVAATPAVTGWTNQLLMVKHGADGRVVLALAEETCTEEERTLVFRDEDGNKTMPR